MGGRTYTAAGIIEMYTNQFTQAHGDRPNLKNIAIIITDGMSTIDQNRTVPEAINARNRGIRIYCVGITTSVNEQELKEMSSMPQIEGQTYWQSTDFTTLGDVTDTLVQETCGTPSPTTAPTPTPSGMQHVANIPSLSFFAQKHSFIYCVSFNLVKLISIQNSYCVCLFGFSYSSLFCSYVDLLLICILHVKHPMKMCIIDDAQNCLAWSFVQE